jgi:hypothetical protein
MAFLLNKLFLFEGKDNAKEQLLNELVEVCQRTVGLKASKPWGIGARTSHRHFGLRRIVPILDSKNCFLANKWKCAAKKKGDSK